LRWRAILVARRPESGVVVGWSAIWVEA